MVQSPSDVAPPSLWRLSVVVLVAAVSLVSEIPDVALWWHPTASFGFFVDGDDNVIGVTPGLPRLAPT